MHQDHANFLLLFSSSFLHYIFLYIFYEFFEIFFELKIHEKGLGQSWSTVNGSTRVKVGKMTWSGAQTPSQLVGRRADPNRVDCMDLGSDPG